jgi:hypothetical protein
MIKLTVLIIIAAVSFGCARTLVSMKDECSSYGFKEGSDKYGECMMILSQRDIDRRQKISDSIRDLTKAPEPAKKPNKLSDYRLGGPGITCESKTFGGTTTTTCN